MSGALSDILKNLCNQTKSNIKTESLRQMRVHLSQHNEVAKSKKHFLDFALGFEMVRFKARAIMTKGFGNEKGI